MSAPTDVELSCNDSPLAIAGAIVTFATLAYALLLGIWLRLQEIYSAFDSYSEHASVLADVVIEIAHLNSKIRGSLRALGNEDNSRTSLTAQDLLSEAEQSHKQMIERLKAHRSLLTSHPRNLIPIYNFWWLWWLSSLPNRDSFKWHQADKEIREKLPEMQELCTKMRTTSHELKERIEDRQRNDQNSKLSEILHRVEIIENLMRTLRDHQVHD